MRGGITMKLKNIITMIYLLAIGVATHTAYMPTNGPLLFTDTVINNGIITATVQGANSPLPAEQAAINAFAVTLPNIGAQQRLYQCIISSIKNSQTNLALEALKAYERVIMYIYHDKAYCLKMRYNPYLPIQGVRYSWFNLFSYINPYSWIGDNNKELDQLLNELNKLADIANGKDPLLSARMKATVHSYKHWRKYMFAIAYLFYDIGKREQKDTIIKALISGSPKKFAKRMFNNIKTDISNFIPRMGNKPAKGLEIVPLADNQGAMPPSPEDAIIHEMSRLKEIKEELLNKQILAIGAENNARTAKQLVDEYDVFYQEQQKKAYELLEAIRKPSTF